MTDKYTEWTAEAMHEVKRGVLMTMSRICKRRDQSDMNYFTSQQLDDLKDCVEILEGMHSMHHHGHHEHMATPAATAMPRSM